MNRLHSELQASLDQLERRSLRRRLSSWSATGPYLADAGRRMVNLASNDYLGLSQHPRIKQAAIDAIEHLGTGAGASRLVAGHLELHERIERQFAAFKHQRAALLLPTGYMANLGALAALAGPGDLICIDKLDHASLIDAARATAAEVRTFPHLAYDKLQRLLRRHAGSPSRSDRSAFGTDQSARTHRSRRASPASRPARRFIVTDSVFSMDGDTADLPAICDLAERYDAVVVVDEAHATGVLGDDGSGLCKAQGVVGRVDVVVSTASKALGSLGGIVTAAEPIIETMVNHARSLIYTTAAPPAQAAAIGAALEVVRTEPWRRKRVQALAEQLRRFLIEAGWTLPQTAHVSPIIPLTVGTSERALTLARHLQKHGFLAVAIRPPTVPPGTARVRLSLRADLADDDISQLMEILGRWRPQ